MDKKKLKKIKIKSLKIIKLSEGNIMHVIKNNKNKKFIFGEAYFSKIKFGKVKAWKFHKKMKLNLVVPCGKVKFVFYSKQNNTFREIIIGEKKYYRLTVPPKIWFGFKGMSKKESIILNIANILHDPKESLKCEKNLFSYTW